MKKRNQTQTKLNCIYSLLPSLYSIAVLISYIVLSIKFDSN